MAGKSIEDILRQQAAQRQAQIQQQQAQERAVNEQRERARQDYLQRMRMFEALSNISPSAAAASAGGSIANQIPTINGHAEFILFTTDNLDNWQYVILDYLAETISDIKDTGISKSESYDLSMIENTGWVIDFDNIILFINDNAEIIKTISNNNRWSSWNKRTFYLALFNDGNIEYFDGKVVTTYTGIPDTSTITNADFTKNGYFVITTQISGVATVYVWSTDNGLVQVWTGPDGSSPGERWNSTNVSESADFFTIGQFNDAPDTWRTILVFGEDGTSKSYLDLSPVYSVARVNSGYPQFFGDNKMEWKFTGPTSSWNFSIYDGDTDTWRSSTHAKVSNYNTDQGFYQDHYDGSQYTSLGNSIFRLLYDQSSGYPGASGSAYNIDLYRHLDVIWSVDGSTYSSYTVNNTTTWTKGVDVNNANRDGFNNDSLYLGKSIFLPMWLADSTFRLLCLTSTQSVNIAVGSTTGLNGTQGSGLIPGWFDGQRYASFRVGDYFGVWLAYASNDVYKIYNEFGANVISLTMSAGTRLNYTGDVAVVTNDTTGIEYVFNANTLGLSPSYATYSTLGGITHYGLNPTYTDGDTTPSLMLNLNEGGLSRIFTDEGVHEFTLPETTYNRWLSDEYIISEGRDGDNYNLYFHDWTGTLLATIDTGIASGTSYDANLVKDRVYFRVIDGSTTTYYYFSPTKSDSFSVENKVSESVSYDYWVWFND